jgi:dTDP-4-dehydrorhamnose reductase
MVNATAPGILAEEMARSGGAIIHFSTDYVFDGGSSVPYTERDEPTPVSVYGRTKLAGERVVAASGAPHVIVRTSWVYGTHGHNFLRTMLRLAREREELRVVNDQVGAPTWSRSLAAAVTSLVARATAEGAADGRTAAEALAPVSGLYHLTAAGRTTWHAFAEAILALDPRKEEQRCRRVVPIASSDYPTAAKRPASSVLSSDLAAERLGLRIPDWRDQLALVMAQLG